MPTSTLTAKVNIQVKKLHPREVEICDRIRIVETPSKSYEIYIDGVKQDGVVSFSLDLRATQVPKFKVERVLL